MPDTNSSCVKWIAALTIMVIIFILHMRNMYSKMENNIEGYQVCKECPPYTTVENKPSIINPFIYPYSAYVCLDGTMSEGKRDFGFKQLPITSLTTQDHVLLV